MTVARCPKCHIEVGSTWRWCLACGYDPDGSAQRVRQAAIEARQRQGGWLPVLIVLVGLLVGGAILWRTTPDDTSQPIESPSIAAEAPNWQPFSPPSGGFHVDLPAPPVSSLPGEPSKSGRYLDNYLVVAGNHLFTVAVIDTGKPDLGKANRAASEAALHGYVDELAATVSGEVLNATVDFDGPAPVVDFEIGNAIVGRMRGKAMLLAAASGGSGARLASAAVTSRDLSDEYADRVIDSFAVQ